MTEDYIRRTLPANYPVIFEKVKSEQLISMNNTCNDLCIGDLTAKMTKKETDCLEKCFHKVIEFDYYLSTESLKLSEQATKLRGREGV
jgi:hypothetical protein